MRIALCIALLVLPLPAAAQKFVPLFNGKNLDGWEVIGDGVWIVMSDGTLLGARKPARDVPMPGEQTITRRQYTGWRDQQSWLYTIRNDFDEFDLHLAYWARPHGNSGISIRDSSRAKYGIINPPDFTRTPSKIGYEIQINNGYPDPNPTGSIYTLANAKTGFQKENEWNTMDIESRRDLIRVKLNGMVVAEHPGDPARPKTGPIGLQLHDQFSVMMFRDIRIRELPARK